MFAIGIGTEMRNGSLFSLGALEIKCHKRGVYNFFLTCRAEFSQVFTM